MSFEEEIKELESIRKEGSDKIYSMYLNTDPSDPDQQGGKWKIQLKKSLQDFTNFLKEDDNKEELKNFEIVKDKVEKYVERSEEHTSELQSRGQLVCRLLLEKKKQTEGANE